MSVLSHIVIVHNVVCGLQINNYFCDIKKENYQHGITGKASKY